MKGLSSRRTADAVASFVAAHRRETPRRALLCTYDFDPARFHAVLLPELTRTQRWFRTLVLADASSLQRSLSIAPAADDSSLYELAPVRLHGPGVFHPKLFLLQAGSRLLVGVGSANLTAGGLGGNLELMSFSQNGDEDGRAVAGSAIEFIRELSGSKRLSIPLTARQFLARFLASAPRRSARGPILHSLNTALLPQMSRGLPRGVKSVQVLSPWHSSSASPTGVQPEVVTAIAKALGGPLVVHTEGKKGQGPNLGRGTRVRVLRSIADGSEDLDTSDDLENRGPRRGARLHAKAYVAVGRRASTLWFGSANCTAPALLHSVAGRGNVELLMAVEMSAADGRAIQRDLDDLFEDARGHLIDRKPEAIPRARGVVLCGRASDRQPLLELELLENIRQVRVASSRTAKPVLIATSGAVARVTGAALARLRNTAGEIPGVLWELTGKVRVPFPVSHPLVPQGGTPEEVLTDLLDEFAARPPARVAKVRASTADRDGVDGDADLELELLTKTEHQGRLDRLGIRVALLARRLRWAPSGVQVELREHSLGIVEGLELAASVRRVLIAHLTTSSKRRGP